MLTDMPAQDGQTFFVALFRSWCYNAVATFSLCLLAQAYEQAYNLLQILYASKPGGGGQPPSLAIKMSCSIAIVNADSFTVASLK
jgi:hypothetical protein